MLYPFGDDLWITDGPPVDVVGFRYPTRMAVVRLPDGGLWLWSPVGLSMDLRDAVNALGPVQHLIGPNSLHHLSGLARWRWRALDPQGRV